MLPKVIIDRTTSPRYIFMTSCVTRSKIKNNRLSKKIHKYNALLTPRILERNRLAGGAGVAIVGDGGLVAINITIQPGGQTEQQCRDRNNCDSDTDFGHF